MQTSLTGKAESGTLLALANMQRGLEEVTAMSLVRLMGFTTLTCGCVTGRYREEGSKREVTYIEEKSTVCVSSGHVRNQPVSADRVAHGFTPTMAVRA